MACSRGVAVTPSLVVILLLSTMKGSSNWYCISSNSRTTGLMTGRRGLRRCPEYRCRRAAGADPPGRCWFFRPVLRGRPGRRGLIALQEFHRHVGAKAPLLCVGVVGSVLGQGTSCRAPVHVDVFHADQPGAGGFRRGQHARLQRGKLGAPLVVGVHVRERVSLSETHNTCGSAP
jgi:hypothetical protein